MINYCKTWAKTYQCCYIMREDASKTLSSGITFWLWCHILLLCDLMGPPAAACSVFTCAGLWQSSVIAALLFSTILVLYFLNKVTRWGFPPVNYSSSPSSPPCWLAEGFPPCIISCRVSVPALFFCTIHCSVILALQPYNWLSIISDLHHWKQKKPTVNWCRLTGKAVTGKKTL